MFYRISYLCIYKLEFFVNHFSSFMHKLKLLQVCFPCTYPLRNFVVTFDVRHLGLCVPSSFKESRRPSQCSPHQMTITVCTPPDDDHIVHHSKRPSTCSPHQMTITVCTPPDDHHIVHHTRRPSTCSPHQTTITVFTPPDDHHIVHHTR